jgi:hypothetical protein
MQVHDLAKNEWILVFFLNDISHLSDGLGQCSGVPPNLSLRSDTIWRLLFQKKNAGVDPLHGNGCNLLTEIEVYDD